MLEIDELDVLYGPHQALYGVDLVVGPDETVVLLGANGAGKSTLLRTVAGLVRPSAGSVTFGGQRLDRMRPPEIIRAGVVLMPEGRRIFAGLTVLDNLQVGAFTRRRTAAADVEWVMDLFPGLRAQAYRPAGALTAGEQQVLALGRALVSRPRLLLVDELSAGISPALALQLAEVLRALREAGIALVVVEQLVSLALELADRVYVIENGRVAVATEPARLCLSDVSWQSTQPGGGTGAATDRRKGAQG